MDPNNPRTNLPPAKTSSDSQPQVKGIDDVGVAAASGDELFIIKPPEKKPLNKKAIAGVISLTILGVIMLIAVLVFALIASASNLANDYRRLASIQIRKVDAPLKELEPSSLLNKRDLSAPLTTVSLSEQSQPRLESVLFIGSWSSDYVNTMKLEGKVQGHYKAIQQYSEDMKSLIAFDDALQALSNEEAQVVATVNPADSLSIRSASGSYEQFAKQIENHPAPSQAKKVKTELVKIYRDKAGTYLAWAKALESGDTTGQTQAQQELVSETAKVTPLVDDQNYTKLFSPTYKNLQKQQQYLEQQLRS